MPTNGSDVAHRFTSDGSKVTAVRSADQFYQELWRQLRHYKPSEYGPAVARKLVDLIANRYATGDPESWRYYPPHLLLHSIEANCAYYNKLHQPRTLTQERLNRIVECYKSYYDPYLHHALTEERIPELAFIALQRQQMPFQERINPAYLSRHLARYLMLFAEGDPLPRLSKRFVQKYGLSMTEWMDMAFFVFAYLHGNGQVLTKPENYLESDLGCIPHHAVAPFFSMSSLSPAEIRDRYETTRSSIPKYLHIFIPPILLDYPLIAYEDGAYLVPHPGLAFHYAPDGLYQYCRELDEDLFADEFGKSFERYVASILDYIPRTGSLIREADIQKVSAGRACDFMIECADCILLVECKGVRYSATLLTANAMANDNSTSKIAEAFDQIHQTAKRIRKSELNDVLSDPGKPVWGMVVTYGTIPFVNSPWYSENCLARTRKVSRLVTSACPDPLADVPQVISVDLLDMFVILLRDQGVSPGTLIAKKLSQSYWQVGEWGSYIDGLRTHESSWDLPILRETANRFFNKLGSGVSM